MAMRVSRDHGTEARATDGDADIARVGRTAHASGCAARSDVLDAGGDGAALFG
jgi:hypothetical protein